MGTATRMFARTERGALIVVAAAAAAVAAVHLVQLALRIVGLISRPVRLRDVPLTAPRDAGLDGATFDAVTLTLDLSPEGRAAMIGAAIASSALVVGICAALVWLCLRVLRRRPFTTSVTWAFGAVAVLVLIVGFAEPTLIGIANAEAARALDTDQLPPLLVELDPGFIGWAFAIAVVGAAFEIGQRLQRDSDGLV